MISDLSCGTAPHRPPSPPSPGPRQGPKALVPRQQSATVEPDSHQSAPLHTMPPAGLWLVNDRASAALSHSLGPAGRPQRRTPPTIHLLSMYRDSSCGWGRDHGRPGGLHAVAVCRCGPPLLAREGHGPDDVDDRLRPQQGAGELGRGQHVEQLPAPDQTNSRPNAAPDPGRRTVTSRWRTAVLLVTASAVTYLSCRGPALLSTRTTHRPTSPAPRHEVNTPQPARPQGRVGSWGKGRA
jgi:hypothetical protein